MTVWHSVLRQMQFVESSVGSLGVYDSRFRDMILSFKYSLSWPLLKIKSAE